MMTLSYAYEVASQQSLMRFSCQLLKATYYESPSWHIASRFDLSLMQLVHLFYEYVLVLTAISRTDTTCYILVNDDGASSRPRLRLLKLCAEG